MSIFKKELDSFKVLPQVVADYIGRIPEDLLDVRRIESAWTIREHVYHLAEVQEMLTGRLELMIRENRPMITPFDPEAAGSKRKKYRTLSSALKGYAKFRRQQIVLLKDLTDEQLDKSAEHPQYSAYSIRTLVSHMLFHEYWHMYRIEELWLMKQVSQI